MRALALLLATGCTSVFGLDTPVRRSDAALDVAVSDTPADGTSVLCPVVPAQFDEDGDSIDDRCDGCPTWPSDGTDSDGDGLPNACDSDLGVDGDTILFARMFTSASELTELDPDSATFSAAAQGTVTLGTGGRLHITVALDPTMIELRLLGVNGQTSSGMLEFRTSSLDCKLRTSACSGSGTATCLELAPGAGFVEAAVPSTQIARLEMVDEAVGISSCRMFHGASQSTVMGTDSIEPGDIEIKTNLDATTTLQSVVVYGAL